MNRKNLIIFFVAVLFLVGACSLFSQTTQAVPPTSNPQTNPSQPETATQPPLSGGNGQRQFPGCHPNSALRGKRAGRLQAGYSENVPIAA
jgi:hypothetical protein